MLGLSSNPQPSSQPICIIAVGSAGAEALAFPREEIESGNLIAPWMTESGCNCRRPIRQLGRRRGTARNQRHNRCRELRARPDARRCLGFG